MRRSTPRCPWSAIPRSGTASGRMDWCLTGIAVVLLLTSTWAPVPDARTFKRRISALVVQFLKRNVFGDLLRPVEHPASMPELRLIDGWN